MDGVFIGEKAGATFGGRRGRRPHGSGSSDVAYRIVNGVGPCLVSCLREFLACLKLKNELMTFAGVRIAHIWGYEMCGCAATRVRCVWDRRWLCVSCYVIFPHKIKKIHCSSL